MSKMTAFEKWIAKRWDTAVSVGHVGSRDWLIASMGLAGETGEVVDAVLNLTASIGKSSELLKKHYRDGKHPEEALKLELGDVLHYLTVITQAYGWTLAEVMDANVAKLEARDAAKRMA